MFFQSWYMRVMKRVEENISLVSNFLRSNVEGNKVVQSKTSFEDSDTFFWIIDLVDTN